MKIVGVLIWADESPGWLATAVAGFGRLCDHIVAVDGFYALYPGARVRSRPDQSEAVLTACEAAGAACTLHRPNDLFWGNEIEKRQLSLALAAPFLTPMEDWVCVFDADNHVYQINPGMIRYELENTLLNVATYTTLDGKDLLSGETAEIAQRLALDTEWTNRVRGIYRWTDDLTYGPSHYCVRGTYNGETEWLFGPEMVINPLIQPVNALDLGELLVVHHRTSHRALTREQDRLGYAKARDLAKVEDIEGVLV